MCGERREASRLGRLVKNCEYHLLDDISQVLRVIMYNVYVHMCTYTGQEDHALTYRANVNSEIGAGGEGGLGEGRNGIYIALRA